MKKIILVAAAGMLTISAVTATVLHQSDKKPVKKHHTCCTMKDKAECNKAMKACP